MGFDHHHFPTFDKVGRATRPLAGWILRVFLTERGLIRFALYSLLSLSLAYLVTDRYLETKYGIIPGGSMLVGGGVFRVTSQVSEVGLAGAVHSATQIALGESGDTMAPVIAAICLAGLAFSARGYDGESGGRWWSDGRAFPRAVVTAGSLDPVPPEPPAPPPNRHPLDPDPDDPPLEPLWPNRSRPSR